MEPLTESFVARHRNQALLLAAIAVVTSIYLRVRGLDTPVDPAAGTDDLAMIELR